MITIYNRCQANSDQNFFSIKLVYIFFSALYRLIYHELRFHALAGPRFLAAFSTLFQQVCSLFFMFIIGAKFPMPHILDGKAGGRQVEGGFGQNIEIALFAFWPGRVPGCLHSGLRLSQIFYAVFMHGHIKSIVCPVKPLELQSNGAIFCDYYSGTRTRRLDTVIIWPTWPAHQLTSSRITIHKADIDDSFIDTGAQWSRWIRRRRSC